MYLCVGSCVGILLYKFLLTAFVYNNKYKYDFLLLELFFVNGSLNESKNIFMKIFIQCIKYICCSKKTGKNLFVHLYFFYFIFLFCAVNSSLCSVAVGLYFIIFHLFLTYVRYLFICLRHLFSYDIKNTYIHLYTTKIQWVKVCTKQQKNNNKYNTSQCFLLFLFYLFHINFYLFCI